MSPDSLTHHQGDSANRPDLWPCAIRLFPQGRTDSKRSSTGWCRWRRASASFCGVLTLIEIRDLWPSGRECPYRTRWVLLNPDCLRLCAVPFDSVPFGPYCLSGFTALFSCCVFHMLQLARARQGAPLHCGQDYPSLDGMVNTF